MSADGSTRIPTRALYRTGLGPRSARGRNRQHLTDADLVAVDRIAATQVGQADPVAFGDFGQGLAARDDMADRRTVHGRRVACNVGVGRRVGAEEVDGVDFAVCVGVAVVGADDDVPLAGMVQDALDFVVALPGDGDVEFVKRHHGKTPADAAPRRFLHDPGNPRRGRFIPVSNGVLNHTERRLAPRPAPARRFAIRCARLGHANRGVLG